MEGEIEHERKREPKQITPLETLLEKYVEIVSTDGRVFVGFLKGLDQALNAFLSQCYERIFSADEGVMSVPNGVYLIRGENIMMIGEIDEDIDSHMDYPNIKAEPLPPIVN